MSTNADKKLAAASAAEAAKRAAEALSATIHDSAQQIWQAGLGAFTRAQHEGSKTFDTLVREGVDIQRTTQAAAQDKIAQASEAMASIASEFRQGASGQWSKLGTLFEDRVARALDALGTPGAADIAALTARVDALSLQLEQLTAARADAAPARRRDTTTPAATKPQKAAVAARTKAAPSRARPPTVTAAGTAPKPSATRRKTAKNGAA